MELGKQIRKYRSEMPLSQEELAEKVFVSRQTISNWENDKNYPDIKSLVLLSEVFGVSLDQLVKGDLEIMKKQIGTEEHDKFEKDSGVFSILLIATFILPIPLVHFLGLPGLGILVLLFGICLYYAFRVEKYKKTYDIQTWKEIVAFSEGKSLTEIEKARESGKRPYQKVLAAIASGVITALVALIMIWLLG